MTPSACILLADGFEEIEAVAVIDILCRGKINLTVVGFNTPVTSARKIRLIPDVLLSELSLELFDAVILPGGEPGTSHLENNDAVKQLVTRHASQKKLIAAICAAPRILNDLGLLQGIRATSFPGTKPRMTQCIYTEEAVVTDQHIITSRGAGTSLAFAYAILAYLTSAESVEALKKTMVFGE